MPGFLIVGGGSMGKRRVRCLLACGVPAAEIIVCDTRPDRLAEAREKYGVPTTPRAASVLSDPAVKAVFVAVPAFLHLDICRQAVAAGKHWFCEAPWAVKPDGLEALAAATRERSRLGAVGCQLLFHPLAQALKRFAEDPATGPVLAGSYSLGTYLPDWHPYEDYRGYYVNDAAKGGGNLDVIGLDVSWIRWIVGRRIEAVTCRSSKTGALELAGDTPDHHEIILEFAAGPMLSLHFDALDRTHERWLRLVATGGTAKWSQHEPCLRLFDAASKTASTIDEPPGYHYERCYEAEIRHFLDCLETGAAWPFTFEQAVEAVRVLAALDESNARRATVRLADIAAGQESPANKIVQLLARRLWANGPT